MSDHEWESVQSTELHARAVESRRLAEQLSRSGFHAEAARHALDAKLFDLRAAAFRATSPAA
jgi:hypothetical protein